ncbi:MAG TPA: rod shape-determining protein MreC, partial [Verrucomicrobiae bacterium]|nr:rod shape-determining protein MreC [Verrucomicrobiae bacterium]
MARRRSSVRRAGGGRRIPAGVLLAVALGVGAVILVAVQNGRMPGEGGAQQAVDDGAAAAGRVATGPARAGENFFQRVGGMWNANDRVEELERENRELMAWRELAERLAERNARYEALLRMPEDAFGQGADIENSIAAQLVLDSGGPFTRTLVANAGSDHGVRSGYIALNENGLIGRVVSVGQRSSRVLMLDDYNSRIPVMGEASRVRAVLAGQATRPPELVMYPYQLQAPRLDFIVGAQSLREGERIITSGDGGLYPRGIPVGIARQQSDGSWRVALAAAQQPIDFVRLIPFVGVAPPEATPAEGDNGPPLSATSSVAVIGRETMAPVPAAPTTLPQPATPRPATTQTPAQTQPA